MWQPTEQESCNPPQKQEKATHRERIFVVRVKVTAHKLQNSQNFFILVYKCNETNVLLFKFSNTHKIFVKIETTFPYAYLCFLFKVFFQVKY